MCHVDEPAVAIGCQPALDRRVAEVEQQHALGIGKGVAGQPNQSDGVAIGGAFDSDGTAGGGQKRRRRGHGRPAQPPGQQPPTYHHPFDVGPVGPMSLVPLWWDSPVGRVAAPEREQQRPQPPPDLFGHGQRRRAALRIVKGGVEGAQQVGCGRVEGQAVGRGANE